MRILVISNYYPPFDLGGLEQLAADVVAALQARHHRVHVLTSRHGAASRRGVAHVQRLLHLDSADHLHYHPHYAFTAWIHARRNARAVATAVADVAPDVVFIWGMWNLPRSVARQAERLCPGRVVYYIASPWPTDIDPHTAYWTAPASRPALRALKRWAAVGARALLSGQPGPLPEFSHVLCVSDFMRLYMTNAVGVPPSQVSVVHNGIDLARFVPRVRCDPATNLQLLYAGALSEHKGVHVAIDALGQLIHGRGMKNVRLTLVGGGHPAYARLLRDRVAALGLTNIVTFLERRDPAHIPDLLVRFDVFVFPSVWDEPLARSVQEAMACGLVVVGTTTGGTPEILIDGETGLCVAPNDPRSLAEKIADVAADPGLQERLRRNARRIVEERFTLERMVREIERHLAQIVASNPVDMTAGGA